MPITRKDGKSTHLKDGNSVKTKPLVISMAVCLLIFNLWVSPPAFGSRIDLIVDHGVDKNAETEARAAVSGIIDFFQKTYGIGLQRDIRIKFSCDKLNYKKAIMTLYGRSEASAAFQANHSVGMQSKGTLVVDLGERSNRHGKLFTLCHEIVHFYQGQESQDKHGSIRWISEGSADAIAAQIMGKVSGEGSEAYKKLWIGNLKNARNWPRLENLHAHNQMRSAVAYNTSALAVLTLVEWRGYPALINYFRKLKNASPEDAFYQAFGARLSDFEKSFRPF